MTLSSFSKTEIYLKAKYCHPQINKATQAKRTLFPRAGMMIFPHQSWLA